MNKYSEKHVRALGSLFLISFQEFLFTVFYYLCEQLSKFLLDQRFREKPNYSLAFLVRGKLYIEWNAIETIYFLRGKLKGPGKCTSPLGGSEK